MLIYDFGWYLGGCDRAWLGLSQRAVGGRKVVDRRDCTLLFGPISKTEGDTNRGSLWTGRVVNMRG